MRSAPPRPDMWASDWEDLMQSVPNPSVTEPATADPPPVPAESLAVAASASSSAEPETVKRAFPPLAELPTQQGAEGLRFDFNDGCRVVVAEAGAPWRLRLSDLDTGNVLFETELKSGRINST